MKRIRNNRRSKQKTSFGNLYQRTRIREESSTIRIQTKENFRAKGKRMSLKVSRISMSNRRNFKATISSTWIKEKGTWRKGSCEASNDGVAVTSLRKKGKRKGSINWKKACCFEETSWWSLALKEKWVWNLRIKSWTKVKKIWVRMTKAIRRNA